MRKVLIAILVILSIILFSKMVYSADYVLSGKLTDSFNSPLQVKVSAGTLTTTTNSNGNYQLTVPQGTYNINYSTSNLWIYLTSFPVNSNVQDLINYINQTATKTYFIIGSDKNQSIQVSSATKPANVTINGTLMSEVSSLPSLTENTWYYDSSAKNLYIKTKSYNCTDGTAYGSCSATMPLYCSSGMLVNNCSQCGCASGYSCQTGGTCKLSTTQCTPGNDIIKQVTYPSGSCALGGYQWSHSTCGSNSVCNQGSCKLVSSTMTSYTLPSGTYARGDTVSIPYTIKNTGQTPWCFLTESGITKSDGSNAWPDSFISVAVGSLASSSVSYPISCSGPLGVWSGSLYSTSDYYANGGWTLWNSPTSYSFNVVQCLNNQDCTNCLGSGYTCDLTSNTCNSGGTGGGGSGTSTCSDGTAYGSCSTTRPLYCDSVTKKLINGCGTPYNCGCSSGTCLADGSCSSTPSDNLAVIPDAWAQDGAYGYDIYYYSTEAPWLQIAHLDSVVEHTPGKPSIRVDAHNPRNFVTPTWSGGNPNNFLPPNDPNVYREFDTLDYPSISPGDHVVVKVWIKTGHSTLGQDGVAGNGAIIAFDVRGTTSSGGYGYSWFEGYGENWGIDDPWVPFNKDWTLKTIDWIVPATLTDTGTGQSFKPENMVLCPSVSSYFPSTNELIDGGQAWFADFELYITH